MYIGPYTQHVYVRFDHNVAILRQQNTADRHIEEVEVILMVCHHQVLHRANRRPLTLYNKFLACDVPVSSSNRFTAVQAFSCPNKYTGPIYHFYKIQRLN